MLQGHLKRMLHLGQKLPNIKVSLAVKEGNQYAIQKEVDLLSLFTDKKVVLVGFPGAFTPTCTGNHLPEFNFLHNQFKAKGVHVVGVAVNDPFVLKKFGEALKGSIPFISDGNGTLIKALEGGVDLSANNLGYRARRFTLLIENGTVAQVNDEKGPALTIVSKAQTILNSLN
jgi:glutaredoxin/glutathione-dependent peroxiredoxin